MRGGDSSIHRVLLVVKAQLQAIVAPILPALGASLLTDILLGVEAGIPERVKGVLSTSGTMYVIAISGVNLYKYSNFGAEFKVAFRYEKRCQ